MIMFNRLPYFVILQGKNFKINVDFRIMISFENKILDKKISNSEKVEYGLRNFYPAFFSKQNYNTLLLNKELRKEACEKLIWFYKCGRENYHNLKSGSGKISRELYSYEYDDEYIYGAFYQEYGIDLTRSQVHWWKFKALLKSLKEDVEFVKIKGYRAYSGDDENLKELKKYWELPIPTEEQERLDKLYEMLK